MIKKKNNGKSKKYNWVYVRIPRTSIITESSTSLLVKLNKYTFWFSKEYATNSDYCLTTSLSVADGFEFNIESNDGKKTISGTKLVELIEKTYPEINQHNDNEYDKDNEDKNDWEDDLE